MPQKNLFSIIIPAYNEERRIEKTLKNFYNYFSKKQKIEIIVVCDGITDNTEKIVKKFAKKHKNICLLSFPSRLGKGGGVLKGINAVHGNIIGFIDADGSTDPQNYEKVLRALLSGNLDGAVASRYLPDSEMPIKQPFYRKFLSRGWNLLVRILFQIPFTDTQCGAKIFSAKALHSVARKIQTHGFEFDVEILWRLHKEGFAIKEVPITWVDKAHSTFRLLDIIGMFFRLLKVRCS